MNNRCLICGKPATVGEEYHSACSRAFFGSTSPPTLPLSLDDIRDQAARSVLARVTVTGVQKKLSLSIEKAGTDARFTFVELWGGYILKPPVELYPALPENEHTIMRLASILGIPVVPNTLIRLASGERAYISKRIDRDAGLGKIPMEDFCQISGRMTEDKYKGSVERVGKLLRRYSAYPGLDAVDLFERVLFNYICGNSDMHLKNYSLNESPHGMRLSPAYDLVSTVLVIPEDTEESALTIHGKKSHLTRNDFDALAESLEIRLPAVRKIYRNLYRRHELLQKNVELSLLPVEMKQKLDTLIAGRIVLFT